MNKFTNDKRIQFIIDHCEVTYRDKPIEDLEDLDKVIDNWEPPYEGCYTEG